MMHNYRRELVRIKNLLKQNPEGMSVTDIAKALKKNKNTTGRYLDILLISGHVDMRTYGMAKVFTLSQRIPLSAMLSCSKDLIMVLDREFRIVDINDRFLSLLHLNRLETVGKNIAYLRSSGIDMHELTGALPALSNTESEGLITFRSQENGERIFKQKSLPSVFDDGARGYTLVLTDVTGDILRQREIRGWEERFRMMAENLRDAMLIIENGKCTFVNRSLVEITGYTFEELWTMEPAQFIAPADQEKIEALLEKAKKPGPGMADLQCRIRRKDGVDRNVYLRITSVQHGDIRYLFIILTDVTELISKDVALVESEQRFRIMADNIRDAVLVIENDRIVYGNRRITEITGYPLEELLSTNGKILSLPETWLMVDELYRKSRSCTDPPATFQTRLRCKNGEKRYVYGQINSIRHGNDISTYVIITDVTTFARRELDLLNRIRALKKMSC